MIFGREHPSPEYGEVPNLTLRPLNASRGRQRALSYLRARREGTPRDLARGVSAELAQAADHAPDGARVIADGPVAAAALLPLARRRPVVYLAHNLESSGFRNEGPALERFEKKLLRTYGESWMATRSDARGAAKLVAEGVRTRYVPNVIDVDRIEPVKPAGNDVVLFVADFNYPPNREGMSFLAERVLPLLWERRPDARLLVVGRGLDNPPEDPRVEALGFVEDLRMAYTRADAVVVPLLHGGGSPLKFVEALAYGLPVVATAHAARLLEEGTPGEHFLVGETAEELALALERALRDRSAALALGAAGRQLAARSYSIDTLAGLLAR